MAVTDFASLKTAVMDWADNTNITADRAGEFVQLATQLFNYGSQALSPLRVRQMEAIATLTPVDGVFTLPADYLQYRRVILANSWRCTLEYITPAKVDDLYPDRAGGVSQNFTIIGPSLLTYPTTSSDVELTYYQKIPDLVDDADTNWLLTDSYGVYLHGALLHLGMYTRDADLISRSASLVTSLASGLVGTDELANYAYAQSMPRGITIA